MTIEPETERLLLRQWRPSDREPFAAMNADPIVMEHFPQPLVREESDAMADKIESLITGRGWGIWALELKQEGKFIGFTGLHEPAAELPFSPCTEIGWRLGYQYWGKGYATEAASRALQFAFEELALDEVVSFTALGNRRSRAVMERLGMRNTGNNFLHPEVPAETGIQEHCLYRITRRVWRPGNSSQN